MNCSSILSSIVAALQLGMVLNSTMVRTNISFKCSTLSVSVVGFRCEWPIPESSVRKNDVPFVAIAIERISSSPLSSNPLHTTGTTRIPQAAAFSICSCNRAIVAESLWQGASKTRNAIRARASWFHPTLLIAAISASGIASGKSPPPFADCLSMKACVVLISLVSRERRVTYSSPWSR